MPDIVQQYRIREHYFSDERYVLETLTNAGVDEDYRQVFHTNSGEFYGTFDEVMDELRRRLNA